MSLAVVEVAFVHGGRLADSFTVSGPQNLKDHIQDHIQAAIKHSRLYGSWDYMDGNCVFTGDVDHATILNWIESSDWKIDQYSFTMRGACKYHSYVFRKIAPSLLVCTGS
jgi:FAD/FMN-containing dehydrogenase